MLLEEADNRIDRKKIVVGTGICVCMVICVGVFLYLLSPAGKAASEQVLFEVKSGDGYGTIISNLKSKELIRSKTAFTALSLVTGSAMSLKPGLYRFNPAMTSGAILSKLVTGSRTEISVTVIEGYSVYDIDRLLSRAGVLRPGDLVEANKKDFFEGRLFPDTYRFFTDSTVNEVVEKFLTTFASKIAPIIAANGDVSTSTLIIASLIEKEVPDFEDRKIISGIMSKRLKAGIPLQIDASICYIKEMKAYPINEACYPFTVLDFKIQSPYNTYVHMGLPPGPIGNPSLSAIVAALHPKASPYWYYLSDPETKKTIFSKDLDEQEGNRVKYLRSNKSTKPL